MAKSPDEEREAQEPNWAGARLSAEPLGRFGDILHRVALTVNSSLELKEILKELGEIALDAIPADRCHLFLLDESGTKLVPTFSIGRVTDIDLWRQFKQMAPIDLKAVPARWEAFLGSRPITIMDMASSPLIPSEIVNVFRSRSALICKLEVKGEPLGVFSLDWVGERHEFDTEEVHLIEAIAAYASLAIRNARLYEGLQAKARALEQLVEGAASEQVALKEQAESGLRQVEVFSRLSDVVVGSSSINAAVVALNKFLTPEVGVRLMSISVADKKVRDAVGAKEPTSDEANAISSWRTFIKRIGKTPPIRRNKSGLLVPIVRAKRVQGALRVAVEPGKAPDENFLAGVANACGEVLYQAGLRKALAENERRLTIESERDRIARDLHDSVGHILTGLGMRLVELIPSAPDDVWRERLEQLKRMSGEGLEKVRETIESLLFLDVRKVGLVKSVKELAASFTATTGIRVEVEVDGKPARIGAPQEDALFRVAHEALSNAQRHSRASVVTIALGYRPRLVSVRVADDGVGLAQKDPLAARRPGHYGLRGLQTLLTEMGGRLEVRNAAGGGVIVEGQIPIAPVKARAKSKAKGS